MARRRGRTMTDKQIIEYKHIKCTKDDCCHYCGSVFCGYVDDIENLEKAYRAKEQECKELKRQLETKGKILTLIDEAKNEYSKENNKLKQTLAEIKEIAFPKNQLIITDSPIILKIQEKISEVEDGQ
jgi:hypothetical protein